MKKAHNTVTPYFLFLLLVLVDLQLNAQDNGSIDGRIINAETGAPLFFVNVYLANTTIGTTTARDGYYRLGNLAPGTYDLVVQHIGYELEVREILITGADSLRYDFTLSSKVIKGDEITVFAPHKSLLWRLNLARFKYEFIGKTEYSGKFKILNPEVLNFQIDPDTKEFIASSDQVLEIENQALGYMIHVIIKEYRSQLPSSSVGFRLRYTILPRFELLEPGSRQTMEKWERNRRLCYEGSLRHFLATLAGNGDSSNSFRIFSGSLGALQLGVGEILSTDELQVTLDDETPFIRWELDNWLRVVYGVDQRDLRNSSIIRLPEGYTLFDRFGNCMLRYSIEMNGYWALKRMADFLPFDYRPSF